MHSCISIKEEEKKKASSWSLSSLRHWSRNDPTRRVLPARIHSLILFKRPNRKKKLKKTHRDAAKVDTVPSKRRGGGGVDKNEGQLIESICGDAHLCHAAKATQSVDHTSTPHDPGTHSLLVQAE